MKYCNTFNNKVTRGIIKRRLLLLFKLFLDIVLSSKIYHNTSSSLNVTQLSQPVTLTGNLLTIQFKNVNKRKTIPFKDWSFLLLKL